MQVKQERVRSQRPQARAAAYKDRLKLMLVLIPSDLHEAVVVTALYQQGEPEDKC